MLFLVKNGEGGAILRYGEIEKAIASMHGVTKESSGIFRGRLRHFQKLGIVPSSPGRGAKIDYHRKAVVDWAIAFELAELGIAPELIKFCIQMYSMTIYAFFESPSASDEDMLFCFDASFLTAHLKMKSGMFDSMLSGREPLSMPEMEPVAMSVSKLPSFFNDPHVRRVSAINLSRLKSELGKALGIEWGPPISPRDWIR
jgi:hypothetical protein